MKTIFIGPSLYGSGVDMSGLDVRPPAAQGDIFRAVEDGATHIGLVDGVFGDSGSVWHKELLYALSCGVQVFGASSMGALRASECAAYGVVPIGLIAQAYLSGELDDDADVALTHAPVEYACEPYTVPLVDVRATLDAMLGLVTPHAWAQALTIASSIHFTERTEDYLLARFQQSLGEDFVGHYRDRRYSQKRADAEELVSVLKAGGQTSEHPTWQLNRSPMWKTFVATHA